MSRNENSDERGEACSEQLDKIIAQLDLAKGTADRMLGEISDLKANVEALVRVAEDWNRKR